MSERQYEWGDKVWVETERYGRVKGIVIDLLDSERPRCMVAFLNAGGLACTQDVDASMLSPRNDDKPKAWRLPEVGDTAEIIDKEESYYGKQFNILETDWSSCCPIKGAGGLIYSVSQIKLVRLHDDSEPPADHIADPGKLIEPTRPHSHYFSGGMEAIDVIRAFYSPEEIRAWAKIASTLYLLRDGKKDGTNDVEKAHWHLAQALEARNGVN